MKAASKGKASSRESQELPVSARYPSTCLGVTSENFADALSTFAQNDPDRLFSVGANATKAVKVSRIQTACLQQHVLDKMSVKGPYACCVMCLTLLCI